MKGINWIILKLKKNTQMTNSELKEKISESPNQEWFITESLTFHFSIVEPLTIKGFSAIYEYATQQLKGWEAHGNLPDAFNNIINYFSKIKSSIISFVSQFYTTKNQNSLMSYWQKTVQNMFNSNIKIIPYNIPEVDFLLNIHNNYPLYFQGAYNFLFKTNYSYINNFDALSGVILAYEFTLKDKTEITKRRKSEQSSLSKLRNDFQKYLSDSEEQLITHLNNININYDEYIRRIDDLKNEKESLFTKWFEETKNEKWDKWFDEANNNKRSLEETYKEHLKLEEPAKYWDKRGKELKKQGWLNLGILVSVVAIFSFFLGLILWNPPEIFINSILNDDITISIKWALIYATLLSLFAFCVRALSKTMFSSFHLARDCEERYTLTYLYLSLLKDSKVDEKDRQLIMQSLFSRADTGLLKDDSSPTMPSDVLSRLNR